MKNPVKTAVKTTKHSQVITLAAKSVVSLFAVFFITVVVHEGAHYIAARLQGIPIAHFTWFDFKYFAPVLVSAMKDYSTGTAIVSYSGGLITGALLLSTLIVGRDWFKRSTYGWLLGLYLATFGFWQICQGVLEGAFHQSYLSNAANILSWPYYAGYASALLGMALYWWRIPFPKKQKA